MKNPINDKKRTTPRVLRGGGWLGGGMFTRMSFQGQYVPTYRYDGWGFRVVRSK